MRDETGQASAEYVGLIALAAALLAGAGAALGLAEVGSAVASTVRTGICIVAGDVCRASDARAAGLEPCTVSERSTGGGTSVSVLIVRIGGSDGKVVAARSDGSVLVTKTVEGHGGVVGGAGLEASPVGIDVGVEGGVDYSIMAGQTWEFPDAASAGRFLRGEADVSPTWRFGEAGEELSGEVNASLLGATIARAGAGVEGASGLRVGRGRATLYIRVKADSRAQAWLPGRIGRIQGPSTGDLMAEVAYEHGRPRELAFRRLGTAAGSGQVVDTVARLDLRDPANRRAAEGMLSHPLPWDTSLAGEIGGLVRLAAQRGTVERSVYALRDDSSDFALAAKLAVELGVEHEHVEVERRLVAASAWTQGSQERLREDCLGVTTEPPEGTS